MPANKTRSSTYLGMSHGQCIALRRGFLSKTMKLLQPVLLGDIEPTIDDAMTAFMLTSIGPSEDETESYLSQWLAFLKLTVKRLVLNVEPSDLNEEENEERRR